MIAITGATGQLGQLVIADLLRRKVAPNTIVAVVRDKTKATNFAAKGIQIREANYNDTASLEKAFTGVEKLLLISSNDVGQRIAQHQNAINAAKTAGIKQIQYTSILKADTSKMKLAVEHLATEKAIRASGISFVFLRNGWYIDNYTGQLPTQIQFGAVSGAAQNGKLSAATRQDFAEAAAAAITGAAKDNFVLELGGNSFNLAEYAAAVSDVSGKEVTYNDMPPVEYTKLLVTVGVPQPFAEVLADSDLGILRGDLFTESQDLAKLIGRPVTSLREAIKLAHK